ncbi:MAG TPA: hypothetical protein VKA16_10340 [Burkholderiales bacterium]|nr:hypothetical protein [Burkholderiales bacterium]
MIMFDATAAGALVAACRIAGEKDRRRLGVQKVGPQCERAADDPRRSQAARVAEWVRCLGTARRTRLRLWPRLSPRAF